MSEPKQMELFPYRDSTQDVMVELTERLPITDTNELLAGLYLYRNTLLRELENHHE